MLDFEAKARYYKYSISLPGVEFNVACYVEDKEDNIFWNHIFQSSGLILNPKFYFYTREEFNDGGINDRTGKETVLNYRPYADKKLILCIDSDYDLLTKTDNPNIDNWVFQTYAHSIENYKCYAPSLMDACLIAVNSADRNLFDIEKFLREYSSIIYPLFIVFIVSERKAPNRFFTVDQFSNEIMLRGNFNIKNNGKAELEALQERVSNQLNVLNEYYTNPEIENTEQHIQSLGLDILPENIYLFVRGHTLYDSVTLPTLRSISKTLLNNKIRESGPIQINSSEAVKESLSKNTNFYNCFLMDKIRSDIGVFKTKTNPTT